LSAEAGLVDHALKILLEYHKPVGRPPAPTCGRLSQLSPDQRAFAVAAQRTGLALDAALPSSSHLQVPTRGAEPPPSEPPTPRVGPTHHATPTRRHKAPKSRGRPWRAGDGGGGRACRKVDRSRTIDLPITSQMLSIGTAPVGSCLITSADPSVQMVRGGGSGNDWMIVWNRMARQARLTRAGSRLAPALMQPAVYKMCAHRPAMPDVCGCRRSDWGSSLASRQMSGLVTAGGMTEGMTRLPTREDLTAFDPQTSYPSLSGMPVHSAGSAATGQASGGLPCGAWIAFRANWSC
jgi:hypothetical protein